MTIASGTRLGPYEIVAPLGAGGMGEVYRARDPRLGRDVAIKVLPGSVAGEAARLQRFDVEARAVAALSHPNVLAIFDIGSGDPPFLVTELLEGETLRALLDRGRLPPRRAIDVAMQIASGLAAAHARGVVHRDLKPDNVFITRDGLVKILDFGLAKTEGALLGADVDCTRQATLDGAVVGTIGYMSPEQVRGMTADHRSDLFAVGVLLHEMVTGERTFSGSSPADTMSAVLREEPKDLSLDGDTPPALARIVRRCLEKAVDDRFQSARDLRFALESISGIEPAPAPRRASNEKSIAVLPFTDMSPQQEQAYFCEGMAEEIITALARVEGVRVAPRTSTFQARRQTSDLRQLAETLGVRTVLEGSVRTAGNRLRVNAQLVDVRDGLAVWSDRFDGDMADVFAIQDEISSRIVGGLRGRLLGDSLAPVQRHTRNVEAYHVYLRGRHHRYTTYKLREALAAFEQASAMDPEYAPALANIAYTQTVMVIYGLARASETEARVQDALARALRLDDRLATAYAAQGHYQFHLRWNWPEALRSFEHAIALNPNEAETHGFLAINYGMRGDAIGVRRHSEQAVALDPLAAWCLAAAGLGHYMLGDCAGAVRYGRAAVELRPDAVFAQWLLGAALASSGDGDGAVAAITTAISLLGEVDFLHALLAAAHAARGDTARTAELFARLERKAEAEWVPASWVAVAACANKNPDRALDWLERAGREHDASLNHLAMPIFDVVRGHPRFARVVQERGLLPSVAQRR